MIVSLRVRNFKSIVDLHLRFAKSFNCLVGMNGAGKTSILQAIDFASHMMRGDVDAWLKQRNWKSQELHSKLSPASNIVIFITYRLPSGKLVKWRAAFNRQTRSCTREDVYVVEDLERADLDVFEPRPDSLLFDVRRNKYSVNSGDKTDITFNYEGSLLSHLKSENLTEDLIALRDAIRSTRSLELLSPHLMRNKSRDSDADIGLGGEKLSAYLYKIKGEQRSRLLSLLQTLYPTIVDFRIVQERAGWKHILVIEEHGEKRVESEAKHINDGLLRVLAVLSQVTGDRPVLLFDEIENGVNPEVVGGLVKVLQESQCQLIVTSHSPLILNYLTDDFAERAVQFVYRSFDGSTKARPFFSIARTSQKLEYMGPGEAFVDTSLPELAAEANALDIEQSKKENTLREELKKRIGARRSAERGAE